MCRPSLLNYHQIPTAESQQNEILSLDQMKDKLRSAERRMKERTAERQPSPPGASFPRAFSYSTPKSNHSLSTELYVTTQAGFAKVEPRKIIQESERQLSNRKGTAVIFPGDQDIALQEPKTSAGPEWFHFPKTKLTPELKRDLQILKMRSIWDPKRHYKNDSRKKVIPRYSQFGTILEGPTEFHSSRIPRRDRKQSFVDEVLAAEDHTQLFRSKYNDIQASKRSGRQGFYKSMKRKRSKR
ncbi:MAG: hypothetical protein LQ350_003804 [Teloschistes chrysophthalmus]|nr:MAG: hypothetical protein LQ350_003804 [Niorma chrysophthalma]